jgi:hypothetical protein
MNSTSREEFGRQAEKQSPSKGLEVRLNLVSWQNKM